LGVRLLGEPGGAELADDLPEEPRGHGQVIEIVTLNSVLIPRLIYLLLQLLIGFWVLKFSPNIIDPLHKPCPQFW